MHRDLVRRDRELDLGDLGDARQYDRDAHRSRRRLAGDCQLDRGRRRERGRGRLHSGRWRHLRARREHRGSILRHLRRSLLCKASLESFDLRLGREIVLGDEPIGRVHICMRELAQPERQPCLGAAQMQLDLLRLCLRVFRRRLDPLAAVCDALRPMLHREVARRAVAERRMAQNRLGCVLLE